MNKSEIADLNIELLEVCIHQILYDREIYSRQIFEVRQKWSLPVQMSRHPGLNTYIRQVLQAGKSDLERDRVEKVVIVISENIPLERYTFSILLTSPNVSRTDALTNVEATLKSFIQKLAITSSQLPKLPKDSTFNILFVLKKDQVASSDLANSMNDPYFVAVNPDDYLIHSGGIVASSRSMNDSPLQMELLVEKIIR